ncbi:DUF4847 family protein [Phocaeicola sp.]
MKLKHILYILLVLPFLWSCNDEDNVDDIFASGTWHLVNYYTKANWDKRNGDPKYKPTDQGSSIIQKFTLNFNSNGTFTGSMQNVSNFEGTWQADGKDRTVFLKINGNPNTSSAYNKEFIEALKNVAFYQGDSNFLMLGPEDKRSYIQFTHATK